MISRVQGHPRRSTAPADRGVSCGNSSLAPGGGGETGGMTGSSVLPLLPARRAPHAIAAFHKQQASPSSSSPFQLASASRRPTHKPAGPQTNPHHIACQPRCLVPPCLPNAGDPRACEDGEGRGAKDTAGVYPRRLRRPHLGPRCRSRYVVALGPQAPRPLLPRAGIPRAHAADGRASLASPPATTLSSNSR